MARPESSKGMVKAACVGNGKRVPHSATRFSVVMACHPTATFVKPYRFDANSAAVHEGSLPAEKIAQYFRSRLKMRLDSDTQPNAVQSAGLQNAAAALPINRIEIHDDSPFVEPAVSSSSGVSKPAPSESSVALSS